MDCARDDVAVGGFDGEGLEVGGFEGVVFPGEGEEGGLVAEGADVDGGGVGEEGAGGGHYAGGLK